MAGALRASSLVVGIVLLFSIACTGGGFAPTSPLDYVEELRSAVREHIDDPKLEEELLGGADRLQVALERFGSDLEQAQARMQALTAEHGATREQLEAVLDEMDVSRQAFLEEVIEVRIAMREKMTRREWNAVAGKGFLARLGIG